MERIYRVEKFSGNDCYFLQSFIAKVIVQYDPKTKFGEFGSQNKLLTTIDNYKVIDSCLKLKVDRLGNVMEVNDKPLI